MYVRHALRYDIDNVKGNVLLFVNIWDMFVYNAPSAICVQYIVGYITVYIYNIVNTILWKMFRYNSYSDSQKH